MPLQAEWWPAVVPLQVEWWPAVVPLQARPSPSLSRHARQLGVVAQAAGCCQEWRRTWCKVSEYRADRTLASSKDICGGRGSRELSTKQVGRSNVAVRMEECALHSCVLDKVVQG